MYKFDKMEWGVFKISAFIPFLERQGNVLLILIPGEMAPLESKMLCYWPGQLQRHCLSISYSNPLFPSVFQQLWKLGRLNTLHLFIDQFTSIFISHCYMPSTLRDTRWTMGRINYISFLFFKLMYFKGFIYLFLESWEGRQKERDRRCVRVHHPVTSHTPPTSDLACNPGMCPDWELNWQPIGS